MTAANPYLRCVERHAERWLQPAVNAAGAIVLSAGIALPMTAEPVPVVTADHSAIEIHWHGFAGTVVHAEAVRQMVRPDTDEPARQLSSRL